MKQIEYKLFDIPPSDLEGELNKEGKLGWRAAHAIGTPAGLKFLMERTSDKDVDAEDIAQYLREQHQSELLSKFGIGGHDGKPPNAGPILIK